MIKLINQSLFEFIYKWRHFDIAEISDEIEILSALPPEKFVNWQEKKKWQIVKHHFKNNQFYQQKIGQHLPTKWSDLPVLNKKDLQVNLDELITKPYLLKDLYVNSTSGSSGQPLRFVKDYYTQARVWAYKKLFFKRHAIDIGYKEARFYGIPKTFKGNATQRIKDFILNRYRFVIFEMSDEIFEKWALKFRSTEFKYVYGYTSPIVLFSRYLIKNNIVMKSICPTLKVCIMTSETCTDEDADLIERAFGIPVRQEYGTTEVGLLGCSCKYGNMHIPEENVFVELNDNHELLITDLFNRAFPFIRYNVGDMAEITGSNCQCGSHNRIIHNLLGRTNDVIQLPSGKIAAGFTFYYVSRALLESSGLLREFIIRQTSIDTFEFDVVSDEPMQPVDIAELKETAEKYLEPGLKVIVNQLEKIERPASGKLKHFYSELN